MRIINTETDGLCFDEQNDVIFGCISSELLKNSTKVMLSLLRTLMCFFPVAGSPVQNPAEDTVPADTVLKYPVQVNPTQGLQSNVTSLG